MNETNAKKAMPKTTTLVALLDLKSMKVRTDCHDHIRFSIRSFASRLQRTTNTTSVALCLPIVFVWSFIVSIAYSRFWLNTPRHLCEVYRRSLRRCTGWNLEILYARRIDAKETCLSSIFACAIVTWIRLPWFRSNENLLFCDTRNDLRQSKCIDRCIVRLPYTARAEYHRTSILDY